MVTIWIAKWSPANMYPISSPWPIPGYATKIGHIPTHFYSPVKHISLAFLKGWCLFGYLMPALVEFACLRSQLPIRVTPGHHTHGVRWNYNAERVKFCQRDPWRCSSNYKYWVLRQRRNVPRGFYFWRRQNYAKYEIFMYYLMFFNPSPPRMFLSMDLLSGYWVQHGAIGPLYVTSSYSTWIFCRGVLGFATDCPCDVSCRGLTTCLLHVGPPFGNRFLNTSLAVGLTYWEVYLNLLYFGICNYICLDTSYNFLALSLLIKYS